MIGGHDAGDEVAVGVAEDDRGAAAEFVQDAGDVVPLAVQGDFGHRAARSRDTSRLGPQDPEPGPGQRSGERVEVAAGVPAVRGQEDYVEPAAVEVGLDRHLAGGDNLAGAVAHSSPPESVAGCSSRRRSDARRTTPSGGAVVPPSVVT
jgi:hypothetical protein